MADDQASDTLNERVAREVRSARDEQRLTQAELADKAGISRPTVARVEAGEDVSTATLEKIAAALGLKVELTRDRRI